jgi:hypothetical protein
MFVMRLLEAEHSFYVVASWDPPPPHPGLAVQAIVAVQPAAEQNSENPEVETSLEGTVFDSPSVHSEHEVFVSS